tara:strand:+ start:7103 stop:7747 length:645 start_codon:yes stop_codon:yes gene_type:complete
MKKEQLKRWLNECYSNRSFIRRIGIAQYRIIDVIDTEELQKIKEQFEIAVKSDIHYSALAKVRDSEYMRAVIKRTYVASFFHHRAFSDNVSTYQPSLARWRTVLQSNSMGSGGWWTLSEVVSGFFRNVRIYIRSKIADRMSKENNRKVYVMPSTMWVTNIKSKFQTDVKCRRGSYAPIFFVEKDYHDRYVFMSGPDYFSLSLTQISKIKELKEA